MPYKNGSTTRGVRKPSSKSTAMVKYVARNAGRPQESKFYDSSDNTAVPQAGDIGPSLCLVTQGTGDSERLGRKIFPQSIGLKGSLTFAPAAGTVYGDNVRVILYIDHQSNGALPAVTDILQAANYNQWRNLDNSARFTILHDKVYNVFARVGATNTWVYPFNVWKRLPKGMVINFDASAGAVTDLTSANIGVLSIAQQAGLTTLDYVSRLRYTD